MIFDRIANYVEVGINVDTYWTTNFTINLVEELCMNTASLQLS